jgi:hypothetical protein
VQDQVLAVAGLAAPSIVIRLISAQLAKIPSDPLLAFFKRLVRWWTASANRDEIQQRAEEQSHPSDRQRQNQGTHVKKIPKGLSVSPSGGNDWSNVEVRNNAARQFDLANIGEMVFLCVPEATAVLPGAVDAFEVVSEAD